MAAASASVGARWRTGRRPFSTVRRSTAPPVSPPPFKAPSKARPSPGVPAGLPDGDDGHAPLDAVVFTVIVDDLVFADGATKMGVLGGGGPQTAFGLRCHPSDPSVGLAAGVGPDLPAACTDWLRANDIDTAGLAFVRDRDGVVSGNGGDPTVDGWEGGGVDGSDFISPSEVAAGSAASKTPAGDVYRATPRAWQITEHDGRRTQVWRTPACPDLFAMLRPPADILPAAYAGAAAYHIGVHPERPDLKLLHALRANNPDALVSVEPFTHALAPVTPERLRLLCTAGDIFSPNELEATSLVGPGTPLELVTRLAAAGARVVCLRRGSEGAVVHDAATGETWSVPAVLEEASGAVVDVTGCGNAFCGGFLASRLAGEELLDQVVWGSVAASLMAEAIGVPEIPAGSEECRGEAARRASALRGLGQKLETNTMAAS